MLLGLETFSYHLAFAYGKMNIFDFIERAAEFPKVKAMVENWAREASASNHLPMTPV